MRWLKGAVIGMGVLIVIGLTVVIVAVVRRSAEPPAVAAFDRPMPPVIGAPARPARASGTGGMVTGFGETRIKLPPGAEAEETVATDNRLIVRLRLPDGHVALLLIDTRSGAQLGLIHLDRQREQ